MATTPSNAGGCPLANFLMQIVHYQGMYVTRETAMELCATIDQDPDLLLPVARLPSLKIDKWGPVPVMDTESAFKILAEREPPYSDVRPNFTL